MIGNMAAKGRVLIVDDSITIREQILRSLCEEFDCISAEDGEKGLQLAVSERVDVVLTDLHMPRMTGLELLRQLRERPSTKHLPVLVMTTETGLEEVNECRRLGCAGYVLKPIEKTYLVAKVRKLLSGPAVARAV